MIKYTYSVYVGDDQNNLCITVPFFLSWLEELGHNFISTKLREWIVCVLVAQSCPTLCDPMDCSPRGSSVHGIFQARILEWVAISFSRGSCWPRDWTWVSCIAGRFLTITDKELLHVLRPGWKWKVKVKVAYLCPTLYDPMGYIQSMEFSRPEYWSG